MIHTLIVTNGSVTFTPEILQSLHINDGDEVLVVNNLKNIVISTVPNIKERKKIVSIIGVGKGAFDSEIEIDNFVRNERESWQ